MNMVSVNATCCECRKTSHDVKVDIKKLDLWMNGGLIQKVFPEYSEDDREIIMNSRSGTYLCPTCWDDVLIIEGDAS